MMQGEAGGGGHANAPCNQPCALFHERFGSIHVVEDLSAALIEGRTLLGQPLAARGPLQERGAEPGPEVLETPADSRKRKPGPSGRTTERARLDDVDKGHDFIQPRQSFSPREI